MNIVTIHNGKPMTTSLVVADKFGKRHRDVLRSIRNLECSADYRQRNFAPTLFDVPGPNGAVRQEECFDITRDGFIFLITGFTGKEAAQWKEKFIGAFNAMESELIKLSQIQSDPDWQQARIEGKAARREATDAVQQFVDHAKGQGSSNANRYFQILTEDIYRALFVLNGKEKVSRDQLTAQQLTAVSIAERVLGKFLLEAINSEDQYKAVRLVAIEKVRQLADLIGRSIPGANQKQIAQTK